MGGLELNVQSHCNPHTSASRPVAYTQQAGLGGGGGWRGFKLRQGLRRASCSCDLSDTRARDVYEYSRHERTNTQTCTRTHHLHGAVLHLFAFDPQDDKE